MKLILTKKETFGRTNVKQGVSIIGNAALCDYSNTEITTLNIPIVGKCLYIRNEDNFIKTSKISEVIERDDNKIIFKTQTSIYQLEVCNEN